MPKFPENTGFKLPGIGSKEKDTPGNFREDQGVENVGYCDTTESHMLPKGSSPLLATEEPRDWLVPDYYHTTYTGSYRPRSKAEEKKKTVDCPEGYVLVGEKCQPIQTNTQTNWEATKKVVAPTPEVKGQDAVEAQDAKYVGELAGDDYYTTGSLGKQFRGNKGKAWLKDNPGGDIYEYEKYLINKHAESGHKDFIPAVEGRDAIEAIPPKPGSTTWTFTKNGESSNKKAFCAGNPGHEACK